MKAWLLSVERLLEAGREWLRRHWRRLLPLRQRLRLSEEAFHLLLAGEVGVLGGVTNLLFYLCVEWAQGVALHRTGDLAEIAEHSLAPWQRLIIPAGGALLAGAVLHWGLRLAGRQGTSNLLEAVVAGDGRLPFRTAIVKGLSSLVSISTGTSIGREGSIAQLTAAFASKSGQLMGWEPYRLRMLVACGAAAGIAAAYNAPISGAVFAAQIVLGTFAMNLFAPLVFASVVAAMVSRSFFGLEPWYKVPAEFAFTPGQLPWVLVLGLFAGGLGAAFLKLVRRSETLFQLVPGPLPGRLALGGLLVGVIAFHLPQVWGNGYSVTSRMLHEEFALTFLAVVFLAKLAATVIAVGSGTVGGVFTPTLFLGAALGSIFGTVLQDFGWGTGVSAGTFALVGMGGVLAATTHSPLLAMIMVFEISLNYSLVPPLMLACVVATLVAKRLHHDTVYTQPLRERGLVPERDSPRPGSATQQTVGDLMRNPVPPVRDTAPFPEIAERFLTSTNNFLPVVGADGRFLGVVALQDLKAFLNTGAELQGVIASDVMRPPPPFLTPDQSLSEALPVLLASELRHVPVVRSQAHPRLLGAVVRAEALGLLVEAISEPTAPRS